MKELRVFVNSQFGAVRTLVQDGTVYFVGKDVAEALGYINVRDAIKKHVDEEDKGVADCDTPGGPQSMTIINESGVYSLVFSSRLPTAKAFKRWVTSEVLPAIRQHGVYAMDHLLENPDALIQALTAYKEERNRARKLAQINAAQQQQIAELRPKATYFDLVLQCRELVSTSTIAKDYGWSANRMNQWLHEHGIQYKQGNIWLLYQAYAPMGYTSTKTFNIPDGNGVLHNRVHTYWTQKGRLFIYRLMTEEGNYPLIEKECGIYGHA